MSLLSKVPSNITKDRKWVETELSAANALFDKLYSEIDDDFDIPSPGEFLQNAEEYTNIWEAYKDAKMMDYAVKHAASLAHKKQVQKDKLDYWCRTDEENIAHALKVEEEYANGTRVKYEYPEDFEIDTIALQQFMSSELCSYLAMMIELKRIVDNDFPDLELVVADSEELPEWESAHSHELHSQDSNDVCESNVKII